MGLFNGGNLTRAGRYQVSGVRWRLYRRMNLRDYMGVVHATNVLVRETVRHRVRMVLYRSKRRIDELRGEVLTQGDKKHEDPGER